MAKKKKHKDVEFTALDSSGRAKRFRYFEEALQYASLQSLKSGNWTNVNVYISSVGGARWWGGPAMADAFRAAAELPLYQQFGVKAEDRGVF